MLPSRGAGGEPGNGLGPAAPVGVNGARGQRYTPYSYPAAFAGVISVGAVNSAALRAAFSDRNSSVVLSAPGVGIIGAGPGGSYLQASGTSPAAAFVTGAAALIRSAYPQLSPVQVEQALVTSTQHRPPGRYSPDTGFGEVDAAAALRVAGQLAAARPAAGLAASRHFGAAAAGPIQVVRHDTRRIAVLAGVGAAGALGVLIALVMLCLLAARAVRDRRAPGPAGPGTETRCNPAESTFSWPGSYILSVSDVTGDTTPIPAAGAGQTTGPAVPGRRWLRGAALITLTLAGLAGLAGGGAALHAELTRHANAAEAAAAGRAEVASRWQRLPADRIFPASVSYLAYDAPHARARRVGITPRTSCTTALDPAAAGVFREHGCITVLRATYLDQSGTLAVTVGVAVMPSPAAALAAVNATLSRRGDPGLRALRFAHTTSDLFGDAQRSGRNVAAGAGPYAYFYSVGHTDGRYSMGHIGVGPGAGSSVLRELGGAVLDRVVAVLSPASKPCDRNDIRC